MIAYGKHMAVSPVVDNRISAHDPDVSAKASALIDRDGFAIITDVLTAAECSSLVDELDRVEADYGITEGTNDFEGFETRRIFNVMAKSEPIRDLVLNPVVLSVAEAVLDPGLLLSGTTSMNIGPGETPQMLHADDGMVSLPRPHAATMMTSLWALSEFRADNGGTHFVPGSHVEPTMPRPDTKVDVAVAEMPVGSVFVFHASLWHGGGRNTSTERRYGLSIQYVAGWCRQQQNLMLGLTHQQVASFPTRLQELIGYSLYKNVMGHVDRKHPATLLGTNVEPEMVWDKMTRRPSEA
jgi:ectoine hydroxylase-related dioxygenase (phytanoyl-CoA dioxygenase family)